MKTSFKKIVVVAAVICVLFAMFALAASATETETAPVSGTVTSGSNSYEWSYDVSTAALTIKGVDNAYNWTLSTLASDGTYKLFAATYGSSVKTINITGTVRKMADNVSVLGCLNVENLNFEACARYQGASSFFGGLTKLKVVNFLGHTSDCVDLTNIGTMDGQTSTFKGCASIEKVLMKQTSFDKGNGGAGNYVPYIFPSMFEDCTSLSDIEIPGWVTAIKSKAFKGCTSLTRLAIPESVTEIADDAFEGCKLTIVGEKGSYAETYANENGFTFEEDDHYIAIDGSDISWLWDASTATLYFKGTGTKIDAGGKLVWWNTSSWTIVHNEPWKNLIGSVKHIEMQNCVNLTEIPQLFFANYSALETVVLPESVNSFGADTFNKAKKLVSVAVGDPAKLEDGVIDLGRIATLGNQTFEQALDSTVDYNIYFNPRANITCKIEAGKVSGGNFKDANANSVTIHVAPTATEVPETLASNLPAKFSYECYTWEELTKRAPLPADAVVSGEFSGQYCEGTWNFDIETGVFEMNSTKSGWCQFEFNGALKTAWPVFKLYVKEMRFTGTGVKIWANGDYDFSSMPYLEKISTAKNATTGKEMVGQIQILNSNGLANNVSLKTLGSTDGVIDLDRFGIGFEAANKNNTKFTNCTSIEKIKIGGNVVFESSMLEGLTSLKSVEYTGTSANAGEVLAKGETLVFPADVRIGVESAEVKEAVEVLGYTNVHAPATINRGMVFDGYQLRNAGYNGLRSVFTFNLANAQASNPDYTLVEYGAILASSSVKNIYGTALTQDEEGNWVTANAKVFKMAVGDSTGVINTVLDSSTDDVTRFCVAVVKYTKNYDTPLYNTGYEIWQNNETGEYSVVYTDYNTGYESESEWAETSIYAVTLGRIKDGLEDPNNEIHWGVLTGKGAVTFTKGTDYDDRWTDMNGEAFGDTFTFLDVQVASSGDGSTAGYGKFSVFEDKNGKYVMIFKDGTTFNSNWNTGNQLYGCNYDKVDNPEGSTTYFFKNQKAPNPYFANTVIWNKIDAIVLANGVNVGMYGFKATEAKQLTYAPGVSGFVRAFSSATKLSSVFPSNYGGAVSNKAVGTFDMSEASVTEFSETFSGCKAVKYVRLQNSITKISDKAFRSCENLLSVVTGDNEFADGVMDFRDSSLRTVALGNSANQQIYDGNKINTVYLPALADGETFTIAAGTFSTAINFRQATFSQNVYDFVANSGVEGMTYTDINGNVWDSTSTDSYESMAGWSNIIVD